jgi:dipeptidyl aminopeptidase/acylaminoacyl peptidase
VNTKALTATGIAALLTAGVALAASPTAAPAPASAGVRTITIAYSAHDGRESHAVVLVPSWYGRRGPRALPLVISPHGRGMYGRTNAELWGDLATRGGFVVVNPDGEGEHLSGRFSWGAPGEIDDLARMPRIVQEALPWLTLDLHRVYAVGGSMGGQETLLLLGRYPHLLAGAVAVDPAVDFARRYHDFDSDNRRLARREVGGTPATAPQAYAERNPLTEVRAIAFCNVPLQIWWSRKDQIIKHSNLHSGLLIRRIRLLNPHAPLVVRTGTWRHTYPLRWDRQLPTMLVGLGLLAGE